MGAGLRYLLAWDHGLCSAVLRVYAHALLGWQRRRARRLGVPDGRSGSVTVIPRINLIFYHGMLAPNARHRGAVVAYGAPPVASPLPAAAVCAVPDRAAPAVDVTPAPDTSSERGADTPLPRRNWTWAQLMARAFEVDVLCCARCGGRFRLIAVILDPQAIRVLLRSLGLPRETIDRAPPGVLRG